ncbi:MAG: DUF5615 family PIN-like protein, partial [Dehalococcoidia bacterium]
MSARLYLDEDASPELARLLARVGLDAISARDVGGSRLTDEEQLARAAADGRTLLTYNCRDVHVIAKAWAAAGREHSGVILSYRQYARHEIGALARSVARMLSTVSAADLRNSVLILD